MPLFRSEYIPEYFILPEYTTRALLCIALLYRVELRVMYGILLC